MTDERIEHPPELTEADEAALDRVWDAIAEEDESTE